jgi:hypothetical protein
VHTLCHVSLYTVFLPVLAMLILCVLLSHQIVGKVCICCLSLCSIFLLHIIIIIIVIISCDTDYDGLTCTELPHLREYKMTLPILFSIFNFQEYTYSHISRDDRLHSVGILNIFWNKAILRVKILEYYCSEKLLTCH